MELLLLLIGCCIAYLFAMFIAIQIAGIIYEFVVKPYRWVRGLCRRMLA